MTIHRAGPVLIDTKMTIHRAGSVLIDTKMTIHRAGPVYSLVLIEFASVRDGLIIGFSFRN